MLQRELFSNSPVASSFFIIHSFLHNFFIRTLNHTILVSTESSQSLESAYADEGAIKGHHAGERITCFLRLHDDFADFSHLCSMVGLITNCEKREL